MKKAKIKHIPMLEDEDEENEANHDHNDIAQRRKSDGKGNGQ